MIFAASCSESVIQPELMTQEQTTNTDLKSGTVGTTYYISNTGNNSNPGTQSLPFQTFAYTETHVKAGDTVIVEDGTYSGSANALYLYNIRSGNSLANITWKARNKGKAVLDGKYATMYGIVIHAAYVNIEGFEIKNMLSHGLLIQNDGDNVNARDLNIHDIGKQCTETETGLCAFGLSACSDLVIERCLIHDIGRYGPGENGCTPTSDYWQGHDHGIYASGVTNLMIRNNVFYNMLRGFSLQVYSGSGLSSSNISFINNTCENGNPYQYNGHVILASNLATGLIANNIFKDQLEYAVRISASGHTYSNVLITNNMTSGGNGILCSGTAAGITITNNSNNTNPLFVNETSHDYALQATSPANNSGYATGVTTDYLNNARSLTNIGAYASTGYALPSSPTVYYSTEMSATATKNDCGTGFTGSSVTYTIPAKYYTSTTSQADADNLAIAKLNSNTQTYANANGTCVSVPTAPTVYYSIEMSATATKNDCGTGFTGSSVTYTIPAKYYSSTISQADANNIAIARLNSNTQAYANANGTCISVPTVTTVYYNVEMSATATKNDCGPGYTGSLVKYTIPAKFYSSTISQTDANNIAIARLKSNTQVWANAYGTCTLTKKKR